MAKIVAGVALVAGAIALSVVTGGGGAWLGFALMGNTTFSAGFVASASMMLGTMGAGLTLSSIAQALQGGGQALSSSIRSPLASRVTIYGQTRVAGVIVYMSSTQYTMNQIIAWASHQCKSVDFVYLDGREVIFYGHGSVPVAGASGFDQGGTFYDTAGNPYNFGGDSGNHHVYAQHTLGTAAGSWLNLGNTAAPSSPDGNELIFRDPNWTSDCTLNGICATFLACASDPTMFASIPGAKAAIHGKCDIYDPRLGAQFETDGLTPNPATHIWTDNAALIVADFLTNSDFGVGCAWDEIDIDQLIVAANICDEQVELAGVSNPWESQLNVSLGTQILDSNGNIETAIAVPTDGVGEAGTTVPTWPTTPGATVTDGNITWRMSVNAPVTAVWTASTTYGPGDKILDSNGNIQTAGAPVIIGKNWVFSSSEETGSTQPTWSTVAGTTTTDGTVTWTMSPPAGTESRYTINGSFDWSTAPGDILTSLLASMEADISYQGGVWKIFPAAWYGATLSFDLNDLTGPIKWSPRRKFRDLFNAVRATFVCPSYPYAVSGYDINHKGNNSFDGQFQPTDAPEYAQDYLHGYGTSGSPYGGDVNLQADAGIKLYTDVRYQFVNSVSTCQRLMKIRLLRNRFQGTGTLQMSLSAYQTCPVDVIQMTAAPLNWANKYLKVSEFHFVPSAAKPSGEEDGGGSEEDQAITLGCQLDVCETDPSIYSWSTAEERSMENISSPALLNSLQVADPTGLTLESGINSAVVGADGVVIPRINATWTEPDDPFTTSGGSIIIQLQAAGASTWEHVGTVAGYVTQFFIAGVIAGQQYNVRICAEHASGATGDWVEVGPHTVSNNLSNFTSTVIAPNIPSNTYVNAIIGSCYTPDYSSAGVFIEGLSLSSWTYCNGAGTVTYPSAAIFGLAFSTQYYVLWDTASTTLQVVTDYAGTLPDTYIFLGAIKTGAPNGSGGMALSGCIRTVSF